MTEFAGAYYLVGPDGAHYWPFKQTRALTIQDGWQTFEDTLNGSYGYVTWVRTPGHVTEFQAARPPLRETSGWTLKTADAASEKFPAALTAGEWEARGWDDEDTSEDAYMANRLYRRNVQEIPQDPEVIPTAGLSPLDGTPDPHNGRPWIADQPSCWLYTRNYWHLLPGQASGFRAHLLGALRAEFGSAVTHYEHRDEMFVTLRLSYDEPQWRTVAQFGRSGRELKKRKTVESTVDVKVPITAPDIIRGQDKATAYARFDTLAAEWVQHVRSHEMTVCSHCRGAGASHASDPVPVSDR